MVGEYEDCVGPTVGRELADEEARDGMQEVHERMRFLVKVVKRAEKSGVCVGVCDEGRRKCDEIGEHLFQYRFSIVGWAWSIFVSISSVSWVIGVGCVEDEGRMVVG